MEKTNIWNKEYVSELTNRRGSHALKTILWAALGIASIIEVAMHSGYYGEARGGLTVMDASIPKDFLSEEFRKEV